MYIYLAKLIKVIDGDTLDVEVDLGFDLRQSMRVRLQGVNAPERTGRQRLRGLKSQQFLIDQLGSAKMIGIKTYKIEKYGRYLADVYFSKRSTSTETLFQEKNCLNKMLLKQKLAIPYMEVKSA